MGTGEATDKSGSTLPRSFLPDTPPHPFPQVMWFDEQQAASRARWHHLTVHRVFQERLRTYVYGGIK